MNKTIFILLTVLALNQKSSAQEAQFKKKTIQFALIYPAGTSGTASSHNQYLFSFNLLAGITGKITGFELGGAGNINKSEVKGFQAAGVFNITKGDFSGFRSAGLFNISKGITSGFQVAGLFNKTRKINGLQIALINISDTTGSGVSVGLLNIVKKGGYKESEISFSDYQNIGLSFKNGNKMFYNIYNVGYNFLADPLWSAGIGFGHLEKISKTLDFQPEAMATVYFKQNFSTFTRALTYRLKLGMVYKVTPDIGLSLAPSIFYSDMQRRSNGTYGYTFSKIKPFNESINEEHKTQFGAGFSIGLSLNNIL